MSRDAEVLEQLRDVIDPDLGKDIVTLGFIKNLEISDAGAVTFVLELTTPACPVKEKFKSDCETRIKRLPWVTSVALTMSARKGGANALASSGKGLQQVKAIIAVASCKGGVGKSTVAVNLAYSLALAGGKVGIFDADVYGPSLPTMVSTEFSGLYQREGLIIPLMYKGVKLMSFGYASANSGGGAAIMRGQRANTASRPTTACASRNLIWR